MHNQDVALHNTPRTTEDVDLGWSLSAELEAKGCSWVLKEVESKLQFSEGLL